MRETHNWRWDDEALPFGARSSRKGHTDDLTTDLIEHGPAAIPWVDSSVDLDGKLRLLQGETNGGGC